MEWVTWHTEIMVKVKVVLGDITGQQVDAVVNAASTQMRGGGGVDGAIHAAAGPGLLEELRTLFPHGLETGQAGASGGHNLAAKHIIHTPGPNYRAGQTDRNLLVSSYRNSLQLADQLHAKTVAFPLISAGIFGWPLEDAITVAVETLTTTPTDVEEIRIVVLDPQIEQKLSQALTF